MPPTAPPRPWKPIVAAWPEPARDAWSDLADGYESAGIDGRTAEALAYLTLRSLGVPDRIGVSGPAPKADLPWRRVVAGWPDARRERWGRRANALADAGVPWPEDERRAFQEIGAEPKPEPEPGDARRGRSPARNLFDPKG